MADKKFWVCEDRGAHEAWYASVREGDTYQDHTGSQGTFRGEYPTEEAAKAAVEELEQCDARERGTYCYAPTPPTERVGGGLGRRNRERKEEGMSGHQCGIQPQRYKKKLP